MTSSQPSNSVPITLKPRKPKEDSTLPSLVHRIALENGAFRNVSEKQLEDDIERENFVEKTETKLDVPKHVERKYQDIEGQQKELLNARNELMVFVDEARNQAAMCLDLLSFQLKKEGPPEASQTLSPFIKQNFPQGSLGLTRSKPVAKSEKQRKDDQLITLGWSVENLQKSANALSKAARSLKEEVERENRYWHGLSEVKKRGWSICRMPGQRHVVGVRFGFLESNYYCLCSSNPPS